MRGSNLTKLWGVCRLACAVAARWCIVLENGLVNFLDCLEMSFKVWKESHQPLIIFWIQYSQEDLCDRKISIVWSCDTDVMKEVFLSPQTRSPSCFDNKKSEGHLNIKMSSNHHRNPHDKDKTVSWPSYLHNGNPYAWKDGLYIEKGLRCQWRSLWQGKLHSPFVLSFVTAGLQWHNVLWHVKLLAIQL